MERNAYICNANNSNSGVYPIQDYDQIGVSSVSRIASLYGLFAAKTEGTLSFCTYIFNRKTC